MEIIELRNTVTKVKNSIEKLNSRLGQVYKKDQQTQRQGSEINPEEKKEKMNGKRVKRD